MWGTYYHPRVDEPPVPEQQLEENATHAPDVRDIPAVLIYIAMVDAATVAVVGVTTEEEGQWRLQGYREREQRLVVVDGGVVTVCKSVCLEPTLPTTTISGAKKPGEPQKSLKRFVA